MRISRRAIQAAVAMVSAGVSAAAWAVPVSYDLRFTDGSHSTIPITGQTYPVELWCRVAGTDGNTANEALANSYIVIMSRQVGGGAILSGGLSGGQTSAPFNDTISARNGAASDLNGDGIMDWGSTSTAAANTNYMLCRTGTIGGETGVGTIGQAVDANTWEFKIATFNLQIGAGGYGAGQTFLEVVKPNMKANVGAWTYAAAYSDGSHFNVDTSNQQGAYTSSQGIVLGIPEPSSAAALGAAGLALLSRRRRVAGADQSGPAR